MSLAPSDLMPSIYDLFVECGFSKLAKRLNKKSDSDLEQQQGGIRKKSLLKICKYYVKNHQKLQTYYSNQKLTNQDLLPLAYDLLEQSGYNKLCKKLSKQATIPDKRQGLQKKKLLKICKYYVKNHQKMLKFYENNQCEDVEPVKQKKVKTVGQNEEKNVLEGEGQEQNNNNFQQNEEAKYEDDYNHEEQDMYSQNYKPPKRSFSRVDYSRMQNYKSELRDNSFFAKFKYGEGDSFGQLGHERLIKTRGKGFQKAKQKMKNKNFAGGRGVFINTSMVNSIKL